MKSNTFSVLIPAVNFHLWEPCNMRCKFCFATFQDVKQSILPKGHLPKEQAIEVVQQLANIGFKKITFAGGEPTLCPWLPDLIAAAKEAGLTTMIVSNGSRINDAFLEENKNTLDWIAISIDSLNPETNIEMGRALIGINPLTLEYYTSLINKIKKYGYGLKINSVISSKNWHEDMTAFIRFAKPKRWKVLQVLPISGQNDKQIDDFIVTNKQFQRFLDNHKKLKEVTTIISETNNQIKGSYAMVDPAGRFFDNATGKHNYSRPILEVGAESAFQEVNCDYTKFVQRGGDYDWTKPKIVPKRITLSGEVASGKSTIGKLLAEKLNYPFVSIGNRTRGFAEENGLSIIEFQRKCLLNPEIDKHIDKQFSEECNVIENLVIDYRLGYKFITQGFHIYLKISKEAAIQRLCKAGRKNETHHTLMERNEVFKNQFKIAYDTDYTDEANYKLVIDVDATLTPEAIVEIILNKLIK